MAESELIGKLCVKTCGRESRRKCVIIDVVDEHFVMIDGNVKRRRCNIAHLEVTGQSLKISKGASTEQVRKAMKDAGLETTEPRKHDNTNAPRPLKQRKPSEEKVEKKPAAEAKAKPAEKKHAVKKK